MPASLKYASLIVSLIAAMVAIAPPAHAATTWTDVFGDEDWSNGLNWTAGVPDINDDVLFPSPAPSNTEVSLNANRQTRSLVFSQWVSRACTEKSPRLLLARFGPQLIGRRIERAKWPFAASSRFGAAGKFCLKLLAQNCKCSSRAGNLV
jgi:hypothetical protein